MTDAAYNRAFGRRLALARANAGFTQVQLARMVDRERSSIANMEAGQQRCSAAMVVTLAGLLSVDPGWLLVGDGHGVLPPRLIRARDVRSNAEELARIATQIGCVVAALNGLADMPAPSPEVNGS